MSGETMSNAVRHVGEEQKGDTQSSLSTHKMEGDPVHHLLRWEHLKLFNVTLIHAQVGSSFLQYLY